MNIDEVIRAILAGARGFARCALFEHRGQVCPPGGSSFSRGYIHEYLELVEGLLVGENVVHIDQRVLLEHGCGILPREGEHLMVRCRRFTVRVPGSLESALMETVDVPWYPVEIRHFQRECVFGVTLDAMSILSSTSI